jgi:hypothetical protein
MTVGTPAAGRPLPQGPSEPDGVAEDLRFQDIPETVPDRPRAAAIPMADAIAARHKPCKSFILQGLTASDARGPMVRVLSGAAALGTLEPWRRA